jgi:hypothetical protein
MAYVDPTEPSIWSIAAGPLVNVAFVPTGLSLLAAHGDGPTHARRFESREGPRRRASTPGEISPIAQVSLVRR